MRPAPAPDDRPPDPAERCVLDLIRDIRSGAQDPRSLAPADRQACVQHLGAEGLSVPEIAHVLKCSDRTVTRDRRALEEAAALAPDPTFAPRFAGKLVATADRCIDRILRITRDRETPPEAKIAGERACFQTLNELAQRLQSLGCLPSAPQQIAAMVAHVDAELPSLDSIRDQVLHLKKTTELYEGGVPPEIQALERDVARAALAERAEAAAAAQAPEGGA